MPSTRSLPLVAICGRPNVGKSTLFNRIIGRQRAIVHGDEGVTRDRFFAAAEHEGRRFRVVDMGGIMENPVDPVSKKMQDQVRAALDEAHVIVFVLDGQQEVTRVDQELRDELYKYGKPAILAVNKLDNAALEMNVYEFCTLGMGDPIPISSTHGLGIGALLDAIVASLPEGASIEASSEIEDTDTRTKVAVVGKPNVGKSSFVNALLNEDRTIVDERPGTTRDAIDIEYHWQGKEYLLIDTAGMRRKAGIRRKVEQFSVARALRAVRRADVCLIMVDATDGISEQDKRIIGYAQETGTAMVLVWTKWDLVANRKKRFKELAEEIDLKIPYLKYVPYVTISNLTRQRLFATLSHVDQAAEAAKKRIATAELNKFIEAIKGKHEPPSYKGKSAKIYYATQASIKPTAFVLFVNQKRFFHFSYLRFVENQIREQYGFEGVPIKLELREGEPRR